MIVIPVVTPHHDHDALIVVFFKENLERMKGGDPAELSLKQIADAGKNLVKPAIMICYEEDEKKFTQIANRGNLKSLIEYLQRGWKFRPDQGDHDRGPERLSGQQ